jgi:hypothetical protein
MLTGIEMSEPDDATEEPDWRRRETYEYTRGLPRRGWAWEFLRRNPDYRREWAPPADATIDTIEPHLTLLRLHPREQGNGRWGVLFRRLTAFQCDRLLVSKPKPAHPLREGRPGRFATQGEHLQSD